MHGCAGSSTPGAPAPAQAPGPQEIAERKRLTAEANRRLAALRALLHEQREQVALI